MADIRILHAQETQAFACRVAAALAADGHSVMRSEIGRSETGRSEAGAGGRAQNARSAEPLVVVWSPQMLANEAAINEARAALAGRRLVPVAVGRIEPPASFAHLPPIDLAGWNGDAEDSRWRFVCEEIELAVRHKATARAELYGDDEEGTTEIDPETPYIVPVRTIAGVAAGLALVAIAVVTAASLAGPDREEVAAAQSPVLAKLTPAPAPQTETQAGAPVENPPQPQAAPDRAAGPLPAAAQFSGSDPGEAASPDAGAEESPAREPAPAPAETVEASAQNAEGDAERLTPPVEALAGAQQDAADTQTPVEVAEAETVEAPGEAGVEASGPPPPVKLPPKPVDDFLGVVFRDCLDCPDMVEAPAGAFSMGAGENDPAASAAESPPQVETVARFAIARREVTFAQWDACVAAGGCRAYAPEDAGFGRGARPVINVSYADAERYAQWLSARTGHAYRLPSEAEWEYAARAGAQTPYPGGAPSPQRANYAGALQSDEAEPVSLRMTTPAGSYPANAFGVYDALGNVREWTADCWTPSHAASASADCSARVVKGGAYDSGPAHLRPAHRIALAPTAREPVTGFRVVRDLD